MANLILSPPLFLGISIERIKEPVSLSHIFWRTVRNSGNAWNILVATGCSNEGADTAFQFLEKRSVLARPTVSMRVSAFWNATHHGNRAADGTYEEDVDTRSNRKEQRKKVLGEETRQMKKNLHVFTRCSARSNSYV